MRRRDREITDQAELEAILRTARICRLAMWDGEWPYIVPLCFGYREGILYFHCAHEGKKIAILKKNNRVSFSIDIDTEVARGDSPCRWSMKYRSITGLGEVWFLEAPLAKEAALRVIMDQYEEGQAAFSEEQLAAVTVFQLQITEMTGKKSGYQAGIQATPSL
ncbi:MAG: pyridoxamine 5'-phosphate oxidase family protein [Smithellaceae bacterium]|nr:pyridoxamine 5'-phosphate oxidase family protein [Smithellaceae bacterium]